MLVYLKAADVLRSYVKSPVASLCFACSSVRNLVSVTMSVLIFSVGSPPFAPLLAILLVVEFRRGRVRVQKHLSAE